MRQPLHLRLRPFLRRDLRARCVSAIVAVIVLTGLTWLGVSALTKIDSREAHQLRVELGLESSWAVCGGPGQPGCNYDDREQERVDRRHVYERRLRLAVLDELASRTSLALEQLDSADAMLADMAIDPETGTLQGDTAALHETLASAIVVLSPAPAVPVEVRAARLLGVFEHQPTDEEARRWGCDSKVGFDGIGWIGACSKQPAERSSRFDVQKARLADQIAMERAQLHEVARAVERLRQRDGGQAIETLDADRQELVE